MTFGQTFAIATIPALITAILSFVSAWLLSFKQTQNSIQQIKQQVEQNLVEHKRKELLEIKKTAILNSLSLIDQFFSWSTIDDGKIVPARRNITVLDLTESGRKCLNELCLTCDSKELIDLFFELITKEDRNPFVVYSEFRKAARKELGLKEIDFDLNNIFIGRLATPDLAKKEKMD